MLHIPSYSIHVSFLLLSHLFDVHLCRKKVNQGRRKGFRRKRDGVGRKGKKEQKERNKENEQKYEVRISSTPCAFIVNKLKII